MDYRMHAIGALKSTNPAPQSDSNRHWADLKYVRPDRGNQGKRFAKKPLIRRRRAILDRCQYAYGTGRYALDTSLDARFAPRRMRVAPLAKPGGGVG